MSLIDPERVRPMQDNVLVRLDMHANAQAEERKIGSIVVPKSADDGANAMHGEAVAAVIVAVGPGRWTDTFRDQEKGSVPYGDGFWLPMNPLLKPGTRVLVDSPDQGDKVFARDKAAEYRLIREENVIMLMGDEPVPLGDHILVMPDKSEQVSGGGIVLPAGMTPIHLGGKQIMIKDMPTEGEVLAVGPGKRVPPPQKPLMYYAPQESAAVLEETLRSQLSVVEIPSDSVFTMRHNRPLPFKEGDRVIYSKFAGITVRLEGHELLMFREESVLGVVAT